MTKTIVTNEKRRIGGKITCMIAIIAIILATGFFLRKPANAEMTYPTSSTSSASADSIWFIATEIAMNATESAINIEVQEIGTAPAVVASTPAVEPKVYKAMKKLKATKKKDEPKTLEQYRKDMNLNMDISKPSGLSKKDFIKVAKDIVRKVKKKHPDTPPDPTGVCKKNALFFWKLEQEFKVDGIALMGLGGWESGWFSDDFAIERNNFTGQMEFFVKTVEKVKKDKNGKKKIVKVKEVHKRLRTYGSVREGLEATAKNLRKNYLGTRKTLYEINKLYCEPNKKGEYTWYKGVYGCMKTIVGD